MKYSITLVLFFLASCSSNTTSSGSNNSTGNTLSFDGTGKLWGQEFPAHLEVQDRRDSLIGWYRLGNGGTDSTERAFALLLRIDTLLLRFDTATTLYLPVSQYGLGDFCAGYIWPRRLTYDVASRTGSTSWVQIFPEGLSGDYTSYVSQDFKTIGLRDSLFSGASVYGDGTTQLTVAR